jgi:hypothetical protein
LYLPNTEFEAGVLRQGDIVDNVLITACINPNAVHMLTGTGGVQSAWQVSQPPRYADAMVLSHSCEIAAENSVKITSVILAPIRDVNKATDASKIQEIIDSNIISECPEASYLKYFYLEPNSNMNPSDGAIVDFSKCFSLRNKYLAALVSKKKIQLQRSIADAMALKLSAYFYREKKIVVP